MRPPSQGMKPYQAHYLSVCCVYSFAGLIRRTPPQTFSDTAITDSYSDTTFFPYRCENAKVSKDESEIEFYVPETF